MLIASHAETCMHSVYSVASSFTLW